MCNNVRLEKKDKPNSFEFGKVGKRHKVYYNTVDELVTQIEKLKNLGLYEEVI